MKKLAISMLGLGFGLAASAHAAPMTIGGVNFDDSNGVQEAKLAAGGSPASGFSVGDDIDEVEGFDLDTSYQLRNNGTSDDDVLSLLFAESIVNGAGSCIASADEDTGPASAADYAGCDLLIFEALNQSDSPTTALTLMAAQLDPQPQPPDTILGVLLFSGEFDVDGDGDIGINENVTIWGFDLALLGVLAGEAANNPLFVGRDQGTPDIAAVVGTNFGMTPTPEVPLPAAAWLFIAGLSGLGFAGRRKKKNAA
ncbi:VPLPA-CTERM sorting domain-containing protein [Hyphococcus sp.]|uniref:VPLPA-CTERM sorting domain-containing protein n=1 Tax=Hyphococcus sp. TaxID=2038636 RepID=UPI003CCC3110